MGLRHPVEAVAAEVLAVGYQGPFGASGVPVAVAGPPSRAKPVPRAVLRLE